MRRFFFVANPIFLLWIPLLIVCSKALYVHSKALYVYPKALDVHAEFLNEDISMAKTGKLASYFKILVVLFCFIYK